MCDETSKLVQKFAGLHAVVIGDAMLDRYSSGYSRRLCPEGPVPVVDACSTANFAGGAANTALNLRALGARVSFVSMIGDDAEGTALLDILSQHEVDIDHVRAVPSRLTLSKHRVLAGQQILLRFDHGSAGPLSRAQGRQLVASLRRLRADADLIVLSDYDYGVVSDGVVDYLAEESNRGKPVIAVDSKRLGQLSRLGATVVKPNYVEALELIGLKALATADRPKQILQHANELLQRAGAAVVAVTLDDEGAIVLERNGRPHRTTTQPAPSCQSVGAGDTYLSAFGLALAAGARTTQAADIAAAAAKVVCRQSHTSVCTTAELLAALGGEVRPGDLAGLAAQMERHRQVGRRIVLTNGCFDILHRGHVTYLERAKSLGDVLVVGVNSDDSIRRLKGPDRPINSLEDRLGVLAALSCVDHLATFDDLTPDRLIRAVRPDVFVKGGDYTRQTLPEASLVEELGGRVVLLPYLVDHSTSRIVERIRDGSLAPAVLATERNGNGARENNGDHKNGHHRLVGRAQRVVH